MPESRPTDRSLILATLRRVDRRLRLNRILQDAAAATCALLGLLLLGRAIDILFGIEPVGPVPLAAAGGAAAGLLLAWRLMRRRRLGLAAGLVDARAGLKDELKTAWWFLGEGASHAEVPAEWIDYQVHRAAGTASGLAPAKLVPTVVPRNLLVAGGLFAAWGALLLVPPSGPLLGGLTANGPALSTEEEERLAQFRELIEQAEDLEADDVDDEGMSADARQRLEQALRELLDGEIAMEDALLEMRDLQNAIEEGNLEMAALQERLEELAADLEGNADLGELAEALRDQDLQRAAELLQELADRLAEMGPEQMQQLSERLQQAAEGEQAGMEELLEALEEAAKNLNEQQLADAEQALEQAAESMQSMSDRQQAQGLRNQAAENLEQLEKSLAQKQMTPEMMADRAQQMLRRASDEPAAEGEAVDQGAMAMPSDKVEWQSGGEPSDPSEQPQGGPAGHATGDPLGGEPPLGEPTRLEVQLQMEILETGEDPQEPEPQEIFQEESRRQDANVDFRAVRQRSSYAEESAMTVERIPWRYRELVKMYFLAIRPPGKRQ